MSASAASDRRLTAATYRCLIALGAYADAAGLAWPSLTTIARDSNIGRKNVPRCLQALEELGYVVRERNPAGTRYRLIFGVSSGLRTGVSSGVRTGGVLAAEGGVSSGPSQGVLRAEAQVSSPVRTKLPKRTAQEEQPKDDVPSEVSSELRTYVANYCAVARRFGLPVPQSFGRDRQAKLRARLEQHGPTSWDRALAKIEESPFLRGEKDFGLSIDFLLQASSYTKILEGNYDDRRAAPAHGARNGNGATHDDRPPPDFKPAIDPRALAEFGYALDGDEPLGASGVVPKR